MSISKGERTELRSVVKGQFKVLRQELLVRQAELVAEMDGQIAHAFADRDIARQAFEDELHDITAESNAKLRAAFANRNFDITGYPGVEYAVPRFRWGDDGRQERRRAALSEIEARVKAAGLHLDRQEADLLRTLSVGALESAEAQAFLSSIPTIGQLVPAQRLAALEAGLDA